MSWRIVLVLGLVCVAIACGSSSTPAPYMTDQIYEAQDGCVTDFSAEDGACLSIHDGIVDPVCFKNEEQCVEHVYVYNRRGRPYITHINARYPCYPDWIWERYSDANGKWFQHGRYRVVSMEIASAVIEDVVHVTELLTDEELQQSDYCYYRVEGAIADLERGKYQLNLWAPDHSLILRTSFEK